MISRIGAVMFNSSNHAEVAKWYEEKLGFPEAGAWGDDHFGTEHAETYFGFNKLPDEPPVVLYFMSDDVDADFATIKENGAKVLNEPQDWEWGGRACSFEDPAGNRVWIYKMIPGAHS